MFILTLCLILAVICLLINYPLTYWKRRGIPYITPHLFYGNLGTFVKRKEAFAISAANLYNKSKESVVGVYMFLRPTLLIRDADLVKKVLVTDFQNFHDRGTHSNEDIDILASNLFSMEGKQWRDLRNSLSPTFTSGKLKRMFSVIDIVGQRMQAHLDRKLPKTGTDVIDMEEIAKHYATDVIVSVFFGQEVNSFENEEHIFAYIRDTFASRGFIRNLVTATTFLAPSLYKTLRLYKANEQLCRTIKEVVSKTIEYREETKTERNDFMQLLMKLKDGDGKMKLSLNQIAAQASLFLIAGLETTAITISFCLHELTQNEEIMEDVVKDINDTIEKHNGVVDYETIQDMHYLEMVVQETIRKYPALPILNRVCTKTFQIPDSNITIEEGTPVVISILGLHRDSKYFENPLKFDPERFRDGNKTFNPNAFIPFGDGPRACIGLRQGKLGAKLALVRILRNYELKTIEKKEIEFENYATTLLAKGGIPLRMSRKKIV